VKIEIEKEALRARKVWLRIDEVSREVIWKKLRVRKVRNRIESVRVEGKTYRKRKQMLEQAVRFWKEMYRKDERVVKEGMERKMSRKVNKKEKRNLGRGLSLGSLLRQ
jgi:hypothetical protein